MEICDFIKMLFDRSAINSSLLIPVQKKSGNCGQILGFVIFTKVDASIDMKEIWLLLKVTEHSFHVRFR